MSYLEQNLRDSIRAKQELLEDKIQLAAFDHAVKMLLHSFEQGGRLYIAGNGGSAADAQHLAAEFVSKLAKPRNPIPAEALTTDTSILTAIGNDFGFQHVFSRQIKAKMSPTDTLLVISTSGNSENIIEALVAAPNRFKTIALLGRDGGKARSIATISILATGYQTSTIQEVHQVIYHSLCEAVEAALFPSS